MKRIPEPYRPEDTRDSIASLAQLKAEMAAAHPDRGGSSEAFIEARRRYVEARRAARRRRTETPLRHHSSRHYYRRHRKSISLIEILLILVGLISLLWFVFSKIETPTQNGTTTKTAENASAPTDPSLQSTKNDLETRMGRVYERDNHYFIQNDFLQDVIAALNSTTHNLLSPKQVSVDDKLTAEEVFASRNKDEVQILDRMFNLGGESCKDCLSEKSLSESERLRYFGLVRMQRMAALTLYNNRCLDRPTGDKAEALAILENQFRKLPREVQEKALDHEIKTIELRPAVLKWFCNKITDDINSGYADPMFMTAREGFFPIEGN
jgi:hypothetical protein